ncbi:MAG: hypothetical protein ACJ74R_13240 [Gaiellaceae bacterium]
MSTVHVRATDKGSLTRFLGWFSIGLGTAQLTAPRLLCRIVGADPGGRSPQIMRALGARELAQGIGILARPRPAAWVWSRVAGDALDLGLLALTAVRNHRGRTAFAVANVLAVAIPDVSESLRLSRRQSEPRKGKLVRKAVTINAGRAEVEAAWLGADELRRKIENVSPTVRFDEAPGDRGTELAIEWVDAPLGDDLGRLATKVTGRDLATQLGDDLRRFKQHVETGQVIRSDATPEGHLLGSHLKQRPARPLEEAKR